jgi:hypothetical protein
MLIDYYLTFRGMRGSSSRGPGVFDYSLLIDDSEFVEERVEVYVDNMWEGFSELRSVASMKALIIAYSKRGYTPNQIAKNLWLLFERLKKDYQLSIDEQVKLYLEYVPEYLPYHPHIQTLLLFS